MCLLLLQKEKKKQPNCYLFEEVLAFLKHINGKSFNYKQLVAAMEIDIESDRFTLIEVLEELKHQGFIIETDLMPEYCNFCAHVSIFILRAFTVSQVAGFTTSTSVVLIVRLKFLAHERALS